MPAFTGQLNANEIFGALYNMIISQEVFTDNIAGTFSSLVDKSRVDGSLYGDTKLFYSPDVLKSRPWLGDNEATNLLNVNRPAAPQVQGIELNVFRQIDITVDYYLSRRAWMDEGAFSSFTSVMLGMVRETKRVYDATTFNAYIGNAVSSATKATITVSPTTGTDTTSADLEGAARIYAQTVAEALANLFIDLRDVSRDYNDYAQLKSYNLEDLIVVWNAAKVNKINKLDLPTMFHKDGLIDKFEDEVLPARYFGRAIAASDKGSGKVIDASDQYDNTKGTIRVLEETEKTIGGTTYHYFAGDEIKNGATVKTGGDFEESEVYIENDKIICKVMHKRSVPFMSAFEVGTSFFNARSLTENHYLTWGHNTLEYLKRYPFITISE